MSYRIVYTASKSALHRGKITVKIGILLIVFALIYSILYQNSAIIYHIFPVAREEVQNAFSTMLHSIEEGRPFSDAAVAFGKEIVFAP